MLLGVLYDSNLLILITIGLGSNLSTMVNKIMLFDKKILNLVRTKPMMYKFSLNNHPQIWETII